MKTKKLFQTFSRRINQCAILMTWLGILGFSVSTHAADGFGINDTNSTDAKIGALLENVQAGSHPNSQRALSVSQPNNATQNANAQQLDQAGNDPDRNQAFMTMSRNLLPLTPDQINVLRYLYDRTQHAAEQYPGTPPKPTSTSLIVNLSPGAAPPIVRLRKGFVTSLVFVDASGASWPISAYDLGDPKNFNVQWDKKGGTLMLQALSPYTSGNLAVTLKGLNTPIMVTLMPGQRAVDYRVDLRLPKLGPNASATMAGLPDAESPALMTVLDGVPPKGAHELNISGGGESTQAWLLGKRIYLRTTMTLLSPAFVSTLSSSDGTHAYVLPQAPVILALSHGKTVTLTIKGL